MKNELVQLGFSKEEAAVYLALLEIGQSTAGPIVKKTDLHRQSVYDTLEKLQKRDLVAEVVKSNRKHWTAGSPTRIPDEMRRLSQLAEEALPHLMNMQKLSGKSQEVKVFEGEEGFATVQWNNLRLQPKNSFMYVIGSSATVWADIMRRQRRLKKFEAERMRKNIIHKLIFSEKERPGAVETVKKYYAGQPKDKQRVFKFLPDNYLSLVGIQIWHDNVILNIFSEPQLVIRIKNPLLVQSFLGYFNLLWRIAKK